MFSNTIKITSLDDYITPAQNCIKPLLVGKENQPKIASEDILEVYKQVPEKPNLIKTKNNKTATVTLNDCLACSGCVTTAETILIQQQGIDEILKNIKSGQVIPVFSIAPQSRASLAMHYGVNEREMQEKLMLKLKKLGVFHLYDMSLALDLAVFLSCQEFEQEFLKMKDQKLPVICSECPGWVCYAEKVVGESIIPFMSRVKSPQQIMGRLLKDLLAEKLKIDKNKIYHVSIMPCYDKKLEAVRPENSLEKGEIKEVDTVISTHEVVDLISKIDSEVEEEKKEDNNEEKKEEKKKEFNFIDFDSLLVESINNGKEQKKNLELKFNSANDGTSNSYLSYVIKNFVEKILKKPEKLAEIQIKKGKNADLTEYIINDGEKNYIFAKLYGLRNIQNFIRNFKKAPCKYLYIEMMACPGGCLNGGGQIKFKDLKNKDILEKLSLLLHDSTNKVLVNSMENPGIPLLERFYKSSNLSQVFETSFHAIEKYENLNW